MKKCFCLLLTLLCISYSAVAASGFRIKGKIVDANNNQPIDFADVLLFREGDVNPVFHALPDPDGTFRIADVKDGKYNLLVRLVGYDLYNRPGIVLDAVSKAVDLGTIAMKPLEVGLAEVEVVAQKKQVIYKLDKKVIEASSNLLAGGGSAVDILENTPSIRVDAEGEVSFRGSTGFTVYVDGKPSVFSGTQALEQIPAGHIENIEIITTPSARHDTGGDVGIINIVTKKHAQHGFSGMVNLTGSTVLSRGVDFLVSQQNKASRWYLGGVWSDRLRKSDFDQEKTTIISDTATTSHSNGPRKSNNFNYSMKAGWMYTLPHTTLNADFEGGYGGRTRNGDLDYKEKRLADGATFGEGDYYSRDDYDLHETYFQGTIGFDHKFDDKGHQLMGSFYLKYGGNAMEYFQSDLFDKNEQRQQGHRAWEDEKRWTVQGNLSYSYPYSKTGLLESGYQYHSYLEDGDYNMEWWDPKGQTFFWRDDIYNTFYFQEGVNSIYTILSHTWKNLEAQAGVRGEHTHTVLRSSVEGADRTKNRFEFFPSVHLGYTFPNEHRLLASYSRRTTRPQLFYMEPYITYRDFYTAEIGNPDIRPEYINSFELNYRKSFGENTVSATAFHRYRKDKIERLRVPYSAGVTLDSMSNVGHDYSTGIELSVSLHPVRWWNTTVNGNVYHYKVKNEQAAGGNTTSSTNYDILWNNLFNLGKYTRIQLDGSFVGPSVTTQGRTDAYWYANVAVRQQLCNRKLTATLAFRDIFRSAKYISDIQTADLRSLTRIKPKYPQITLTLSWTFNSFKAKSTQAKEDRSEMFEGIKH